MIFGERCGHLVTGEMHFAPWNVIKIDVEHLIGPAMDGTALRFRRLTWTMDTVLMWGLGPATSDLIPVDVASAYKVRKCPPRCSPILLFLLGLASINFSDFHSFFRVFKRSLLFHYASHHFLHPTYFATFNICGTVAVLTGGCFSTERFRETIVSLHELAFLYQFYLRNAS